MIVQRRNSDQVCWRRPWRQVAVRYVFHDRHKRLGKYPCHLLYWSGIKIAGRLERRHLYLQKITVCMGHRKADSTRQSMHVHRIIMTCKLVYKFSRSCVKHKNAQEKVCQYFM